MSEMLKGNYPLQVRLPAEGDSAERSLEEQFEASALERLGGSMTFVKKSTNFVWKGDAKK